MFEIDKEKFGTFVSQLRKEKGYTQKELAEKLFISDKAVSKWETASSVPDISLLIPLAELLGVTVTELLMCERITDEETIDTGKVENIVKTALGYSEEEAERAYQTKNKWPLVYLFSVLSGAIGTFYNLFELNVHSELLITSTLLGMIFGAYFCFFVKIKLPTYYDENRCGLYYDGIFRLNIPGVALNNSNWPYIVRVGRVWSCICVGLFPAVNVLMNYFFRELWVWLGLLIFLAFTLGGLFVPMYVAGKRYE